MKFLCIDCDRQMEFAERQEPGDGTFAASFTCPACGRRVALLANPMETQMVRSLGVQIGGRTLEAEPMELTRDAVAGRTDAFTNAPGHVRWTPEATARLERVPTFVRGMVKKIYADYAADRSIAEITPAVMDQARTDLGLEGM